MSSPSAMDLGPTLALLLTALSIINILYTWWRTRDQNVESRFKAGSERMDRLGARLASVEQKRSHRSHGSAMRCAPSSARP